MKLSRQAIQVFEKLKQSGQLRFEKLEEEGMDQSMIARSAKELEEKGLAELKEDREVAYSLTDKGKTLLREGSPEYRLLKMVEDGPKEFSEINIPADIAVGKAREKDWVEIEEGRIHITEEGRNVRNDPVKTQLENEEYGPDHVDRGLVERVTEKTRTLKLTEKGGQIKLENLEEDFNVEAKASLPLSGRKHFYKEVIDYARDTWREMGFQEMQGNFVVPGLLNFDALYTPQDHPAREMHDTFFMDNPESSDLGEFSREVENIRSVHENGGDTGSTGFGYEWSEEEAALNVLRTHTTAVSARKLRDMKLEDRDLPAKFFTVSRNFRNETVDRSHLAEFYQTDGIVVGENLNFRNLKGYINEFFNQMGFEDIRIIPSYYPYTEMSIEVQVKDPITGEYIGLGGGGMFRPEVVKPLLGREVEVLAWGLGIGRIAMGAAELEDIRELYKNDKEILEETPVWRPYTG